MTRVTDTPVRVVTGTEKIGVGGTGVKEHITPSGIKTYLDGFYYTQAQLGSTTNALGASLIGIEDIGGYFTGVDIEAALQQLGAVSHVPATVLDTPSIDLTLTGQQIQATVLPAGVDHDLLNNFVSNEHIDHSGVILTAGEGLTGGGDITASRTFNLDFSDLSLTDTTVGATDLISIHDGSQKKITFANFEASLAHNNFSGLQGGTAGEYFHLTSAQHTGVTGGTDTHIAYWSGGILSGDADFTWSGTQLTVGDTLYINNTTKRVGINTPNPLGVFEAIVEGEVEGANFFMTCYRDGQPTAESNMILFTANGTAASPTATLNNEILGQFAFQGWDQNRTNGALLRAVADADWGNSPFDAPTRVEILTVGPDGTQTLRVGLCIDSNQILNSFSGRKTKVTEITSANSPYTVLPSDHKIHVKGTGNVTINLPALSTAWVSPTGREIYIRNASTATVTIDGNGTETIDGQLTKQIVSQYQTMLLQANSTEWGIE